MTTTATKRMRFAALGLTTALSIGGLAPFIGQGEASAATTCSVQSTRYSTASTRLAVDKAKLKKAKHKLKKAKKHHKSHHVIKHDKKRVKKFKKRVKADKGVKNYYYSAYKNCVSHTTSTKPGGGSTTTPTSPLDLTGLLGALDGSQLAVPLENALNSIAAQIAAAGGSTPGAQALADGIKAISDAIAKNAPSLSAAEIQKLLAELPASANPAAFEAALQDAVSALTKTASNPPSTANGVIDAVLNPIVAGLNEFPAAAPLSTLVKSVQHGLDTVLTDLGLPGLGGLSGLPLSTSQLSSLTSLLGGLNAGQLSSLSSALPTDPTQLTSALAGLSSLNPTQLTSLLGGLNASQLTSLLSGNPVTDALQSLVSILLGGSIPTF